MKEEIKWQSPNWDPVFSTPSPGLFQGFFPFDCLLLLGFLHERNALHCEFPSVNTDAWLVWANRATEMGRSRGDRVGNRSIFSVNHRRYSVQGPRGLGRPWKCLIYLKKKKGYLFGCAESQLLGSCLAACRIRNRTWTWIGSAES